MSETVENQEGGAVGVFAEEEANRKRQKKEMGVSYSITLILFRNNKLTKLLTRPSD